MNYALDALHFPLRGSRLIEASAGTGKTWTIAALYLRLVLGHGDASERFNRTLQPADILVMTFTRAATRELSDRIRARLLEAAQCFRAEKTPAPHDTLLQDLIAAYPDARDRSQAAWRLALAAEAMDDAAIFTIDAWCQRMLREHAFDSGCLFDEELVADESELLHTAVRDYWRQQIYPLNAALLDHWLAECANPDALEQAVKPLLALEFAPWAKDERAALGTIMQSTLSARRARIAQLKQGWVEQAQALQDWLDEQTTNKAKPFDGRKLGKNNYTRWLETLASWSANTDHDGNLPDLKTGWHRLSPDGMQEAAKDPANMPALPPACAALAQLQTALAELPALKPALLQHAAQHIAARMSALKRSAGTFGFADMQQRLHDALAGENGEALRQRIISQYPLAMIDEFQDTSPLQYRIFDLLYRTADNDPDSALLLIGDPKQSIYGFRGADIHSYLAARRATAGRHYALSTNYRSTGELVDAVNAVFAQAERDATGWPQGAFAYRQADDNPLPFESVKAQGRAERYIDSQGAQPALTICYSSEGVNNETYRQQFAAQCAEHIVQQLNDPNAGFIDAEELVLESSSLPFTPLRVGCAQGRARVGMGLDEATFNRLKPADIAVLVRTGKEAAAVRQALQQRGVASVYLSDKDSVFASQEAADMLRWLCAVANPLDGRLARAALATATLDLPLEELAQLTHDDLAWEARVEQLKALRIVWLRQGVLTMLRQFLHAFELPARLLNSDPQSGGKADGERSLTNILHLAELLQTASAQQEGEQALIRWLAEQIAEPDSSGDAAIVRLESDADLVKVVTIHKSKGLEYPLVYVPFAASFRAVSKRNRSMIEYSDAEGVRQCDFSMSDATLAIADQARLQEDLRLFYVALTRPRHALWLGIAPLLDRNKPVLQHSAAGYLLAGGQAIVGDDLPRFLQAWAKDGASISVQNCAPINAPTHFVPRTQNETLREALPYQANFDRDWNMSSFSALVRDVATHYSASARAENLLETGEEPAGQLSQVDAAWHRFPRGALPGNFLHDQLEWLAGEGFASVNAPNFADRVGARCDRLGWGHRKEDVAIWLQAIANTALPALGVPLTEIGSHLAEMEFWFPSAALQTQALDALCSQHLLDGIARPSLTHRDIHGLLKGYVDLVVEHQGRYWVLDYKSNALGTHDTDYHPAALRQAMAEHRYDIQATLYLLALHRLLRQRMGDAYQPEQHLGGAIYYFLRGVNGTEGGCYTIPAPLALLEELDALLLDEECQV